MRPQIVLPIVLLSVLALVGALVLLGGGGSDPTRPADGPTVGPRGAAAAPVTPTTPVQPAQVREVAPVAEGPRTEPAREAVAAGSFGAFSNALAVSVLTPDGQALAGARLELRDDSGGGAFGELALLLSPYQARGQVRRATTDALGQHRFENLTPGRYAVAATHGEYARTEVGGLTVSETGEAAATLSMGMGFTVEGRVTDTAGTPISGALLTLVPVLFASLPPDHPSVRFAEATTDAEGYYKFERQEAGSRNLTASATGFGSRTQNNLLISARPDGPIVQDFRLEPGFRISGQVLSSSLRPVANADVQAMNFAATQSSMGRARTNERGEFELLDLAPGSYQLLARAPGYGDGREPRVEAGASGVKIEMPELGGALGLVTAAESGTPLSNFTLLVRRANMQNGLLGRVERREVFVSKDGTYRLAGLTSGEYVLEAEANGYARTASQRFQVEQGIFTPDVNIAVNQGGKLRGRVVSARTGEPVGGAKVSTLDAGFVRNPISEMFAGLQARNTTERAVRTGADGTFELDLLTPGEYQLEVEHQEYVTGRVDRAVVFASSEPMDVGEVRLNTGGVVTGVVLDGDGRPVVGATVSLAGSQPGLMYSERTGANGRYTIRRVAAGAYRISAQRSSGAGDATANPFELILDVEKTKRDIFVGENSERVEDFRLIPH